jgi:hypothetical protein
MWTLTTHLQPDKKKLYLATASNKPCNLKPQNIQVNLLNFLGIRLDLKYHVR